MGPWIPTIVMSLIVLVIIATNELVLKPRSKARRRAYLMSVKPMMPKPPPPEFPTGKRRS